MIEKKKITERRESSFARYSERDWEYASGISLTLSIAVREIEVELARQDVLTDKNEW